MDSDQLLALLGRRADDPSVETVFGSLGTRRRPELDPLDRDSLRDWVLVRRQGVELGFADEVYLQAEEKWRRRRPGVPLILVQVYFYTRFDDIEDFTGRLPLDLKWSDTRDQARRKLLQFEKARRSYLKDTWDIPGYRMTLDYKNGGSSIDSIVCQIGLKPWPESGRLQPAVRVADWLSLFGLPATSSTLHQKLQPLDLRKWLQQGGDENEIDFTYECGLQLYFIDSKRLSLAQQQAVVKGTDLVLGAVQFFRSRELDARQWNGELPLGLSFDDSQETMVGKVGRPPDHRRDDRFSGAALWHFPEFSVEVLYNNIDNHLLRITLMAPGFWREG
jgi:hypothetical protein